MSTTDDKSTGTAQMTMHLPRELAAELREVIKQLPYGGASISGFVANAVRREIDRLRAEGILPPRK